MTSRFGASRRRLEKALEPISEMPQQSDQVAEQNEAEEFRSRFRVDSFGVVLLLCLPHRQGDRGDLPRHRELRQVRLRAVLELWRSGFAPQRAITVVAAPLKIALSIRLWLKFRPRVCAKRAFTHRLWSCTQSIDDRITTPKPQ